MKNKITIGIAKMVGTAMARKEARKAWFLVLVIALIAGNNGKVTYRELIGNVISGKAA